MSICACVSRDWKPAYWNYQSLFLDHFTLFFLRSYKIYCHDVDTISSKREPGYLEVPDPIASGNTNQPRTKCDIEKEADFHEIANKSILFNIKVEQFTTSTTKYFVKSMARLISSFYVFNVEYPSKIENT